MDKGKGYGSVWNSFINNGVYAYQEWVDEGIASVVPESADKIDIHDRAAVVLTGWVGLWTSPVSVPLVLAGCGSSEEKSYISGEDIYVSGPETDATEMSSLGLCRCKADPQYFICLGATCGNSFTSVTAKDIASCLDKDISTSEPTQLTIGLDYKAAADTCYESPKISVLIKGEEVEEFSFPCSSFGTSSIVFCVPAGTPLSDITFNLTSGDWCSSVLVTDMEASAEDVCKEPTHGNETNWANNGFTRTAYQSNQYCNPAFLGLVQDAWLAGADTMGVLYTRYQDDLTSTEIEVDNTKTPSLDSLSCAIQTIKDHQMKAALYLYVDVSTGQWRADISPSNESIWFNSFQSYLAEMAGFANEHGVDILSVGAELHSMTKTEHLGQWQDIVGSVRSKFAGTVLYFPNQDNFNSLDMGYWQLFDAVGLTFWASLSNKAVPTASELVDAWKPYVTMLNAKAKAVGKKLFFGEIGYPSREYCADDPWNCGGAGTHSDECQSNAYQAFYQVWGKSDQVVGALFWQGGLGDKGYDPNMCDKESIGCCPFKQATEAVVDAWM